MNQIKIGKFIFNLRKNKLKLTQAEFADKLNVTSQAVSKWENGRGIPDIELLKTISEEFNVDISDLLNGEEKKKKGIKSKKNIIILCIIIFLILIVIMYSFLSKKLSNNHDGNFKVSNLSSENSSFTIKGVAVYSLGKSSVYISDIQFVDDENMNDKYLIEECSLYETNNGIERKIFECGNKNDNTSENNLQTLQGFLNNIEFNIDDYPANCEKLISSTLHISITAIDEKNRTIIYKIPLNLEEKCSR